MYNTMVACYPCFKKKKYWADLKVINDPFLELDKIYSIAMMMMILLFGTITDSKNVQIDSKNVFQDSLPNIEI